MQKSKTDKSLKVWEDISERMVERWAVFSKAKTFKPFDINYKKDDVLNDFVEIQKTRNKLYYQDETFKRCLGLLKTGAFKSTKTAAFDFNCLDINYNASGIIEKKYQFIALEGPQSEPELDNFLNVIDNHKAGTLVRLTVDTEKGVFKCFPYWHREFMPAFEKKLGAKYYGLDSWEDNKGIEVKALVALLTTVQNIHDFSSPIACHCSAGVGRTGTFIAAMVLFNQLTREKLSAKDTEALSIERLAYKLSLQRPYMIGEPEQYLTLHELVRLMLNEKD